MQCTLIQQVKIQFINSTKSTVRLDIHASTLCINDVFHSIYENAKHKLKLPISRFTEKIKHWNYHIWSSYVYGQLAISICKHVKLCAIKWVLLRKSQLFCFVWVQTTTTLHVLL